MGCQERQENTVSDRKSYSIALLFVCVTVAAFFARLASFSPSSASDPTGAAAVMLMGAFVGVAMGCHAHVRYLRSQPRRTPPSGNGWPSRMVAVVREVYSWGSRWGNHGLRAVTRPVLGAAVGGGIGFALYRLLLISPNDVVSALLLETSFGLLLSVAFVAVWYQQHCVPQTAPQKREEPSPPQSDDAPPTT